MLLVSGASKSLSLAPAVLVGSVQAQLLQAGHLWMVMPCSCASDMCTYLFLDLLLFPARSVCASPDAGTKTHKSGVFLLTPDVMFLLLSRY